MATAEEDLRCLAAALYGQLDQLKALVAAGVNPRAVDPETGSQAIHLASKCGHLDCIDYLLTEKLNDVDARNTQGNTPLHYATVSGRRKVAEVLVRHGVNLNVANNVGQRPIHGAVGQGHTHVVEYLLSLKDDKCPTCLKDSVTCSTHQVDINAQDEGGYSPLHVAAKRFTSVMFDLLVDAGADCTLRDCEGKLAIRSQEGYKNFITKYGSIGVVVVAIMVALYLANVGRTRSLTSS